MSNGVYQIYPYGDKRSIHVNCDMNTDGGKFSLYKFDALISFSFTFLPITSSLLNSQ